MKIKERQKRSAQNPQIGDLIKFLQESDRKTELRDKIFLILGITGTGKSTFIQYIAGDNSKLFSVELGEDTGEFIIVDNERISNATTESKTLFPELVYDAKTDTNFYDCPGFSDTRNASVDITATYLVKKLINQAKSIKMIFTVSYPSVQKGVDRISFMELVTHATNLIKNVRKYENSIALIVTKVHNEYTSKQGSLQLVSDERIIDKIGNFLLNVRDEQQKRFTFLNERNMTQRDKDFFTNAIDFINILATRKNGKYERIGIFRRPDKSGRLNEITLLQNGKPQLVKLLHNNLLYTDVNQTDFGFTISNKSKNDIYEIIEYLNEEIGKNINTLLEEAKILYETQIKLQINDYESLKNMLYESLAVATKTVEAIKKDTTTEDFLLSLLQLLDELLIDLPKNKFDQITDLNSYVNFLQNFSKIKIRNSIHEWAEPLNDFEKYVEEWHIWVSFLLDVYHFVFDYTTQKNIQLVKDSFNALKNGNYINFFNEQDRFDKRILNALKNIKIDELKKSMLNNLLKMELQVQLEKKCANSNKISIRGNFVKLSEINSVPCSHTNINQYEIFASDTVYIDNDFVKIGARVHLTIIAPTWQIIGNRKIILDGKSAVSLFSTKAKSGTFPGEHGNDGLPGNPGGTAGTFFGIGMKFKNEKSLTITTNGGAGSRGQDGGNGANGQDTARIYMPSSDYTFCPTQNFDVSNGRYEYIDQNTNTYKLTLFYYRGWQIYYGYGNNSSRGGDGGNGGAEGLGGNSGELKMINLQTEPNINTDQRTGLNGPPGIGGTSGRGGCMSRNKVKCMVKFLPFYYWNTWEELEFNKCYKRQPNGRSGVTGLNKNGLKYPDANSTIPNPKIIITDYKQFIKDKLKNNLINKDYLLEFLTKFETNNYIRKFVNTSEFTNQNTGKNKFKNTSSYAQVREKIRNSKAFRQKRSIDPAPIKFNPLPNFHTFKTITGNDISTNYNDSSQHILFSRTIMSQHAINSTLLLVDLVIKKLTNRKHYQQHNCNESLNLCTSTAQAATLNIITEYEQLLSEYFPGEYSNIYDPIRIQTKIFHLMSNQKCLEISRFLSENVANYFHSVNTYEQFSKRIDNILMKNCCLTDSHL